MSDTPFGTTCACQGARPLPFSMALQPIVDVEARQIVAHEALVRGPGGEGAAHVLAQIGKSNLHAFDQACRTTAIELAARLGVRERLNINFLPNAVYEPQACIRTTLEAAARTGFPTERLTFEMIESESIVEVSHMRAIIEAYRTLGFRVALDDFGSGYSGLGRLVDLRPDIVKVDRKLVMDCDKDPMRRAILASLIGLGQEIGLAIVFEGVERLAEVETLRSLGGRLMQGFYFARPAFEAAVTSAEISWPNRDNTHPARDR